MIARRVICGVLFFAVALALACISQLAVHWRENSADSHLFAYYGWEIAQGGRPYLDVWDNKPPGIWWINAIVTFAFGLGVETDLASGGAALLLAAVATAGICRIVWGASSAWLGAIAAIVVLGHNAFEGGANRIEPWLVACELLGVWAFLAARERRSLRLYLLAGAALALAPWFKQTGLAAIVACAAVACIDALIRWRQGTRGAALWPPAALLLGHLSVHGLGVLALAHAGALDAARHAIVEFNAHYIAQRQGHWEFFQAVRTLFEPWRALVALAIPVAVGAAWRGADLARQPRTADAGPYFLFVLWFLAQVGVLALAAADQGYHLLPLLAPIVLLALDAPARLLAGGTVRGLSPRPTVVAACVAFLGLLSEVAESSYTAGRQGSSQRASWLSLRRREPESYEAQGAAVARLCPPAERVYVWGWTPGAYRYAGRRCVSRFATLEKAGQLGEPARFIVLEACEAIRRTPPTVFVVSTADWARMRRDDDDLARWLIRSYREVDVIQGMHILQWSGGDDAER
jgi:hypothetical protein